MAPKNFTNDPKIKSIIDSTPLNLNDNDPEHLNCYKSLIENAWANMLWDGKLNGKTRNFS